MRARIRRAFVVLGAFGACAFGACVSTSFEDGRYACTPGPGAVCPEGLVCARDGRCRARELPAIEEGGVDAEPSDAGVDADCPNARWRTILDARAPEGIEVLPDGRVFTVGAAGTQAWIAEVDRCTGAIVNERTLLAEAQTQSVFHAVAAQGNELVVAGGSRGADGGAVYHGRFSFDLVPSAPTDRAKLPPGDATRLAIGADGTSWISGTQLGGGFVARVGSTICSAPFTSTPGGIVARDTGAADVLRDGNPAVLSFVDSACAVSTAPQSLAVGTGNVDAMGMVAGRGGLIAIGTANNTLPNTSFWLAETKIGQANWTVATNDPNPLDRDVGRSLAFDGNALFVVVSQRAATNSGTPTLHRFDSAITAASKPALTATPFGPILLEVRGVAVAPPGGDAVYVTAASATGGGLARCTKSGDCAP
ncbi:MAG: hypothetical protein JST00_23845 [Deltaproteobacteria bacterium]|nr:hypothetical protein [Deltaproteobacteria bacterium]